MSTPPVGAPPGLSPLAEDAGSSRRRALLRRAAVLFGGPLAVAAALLIGPLVILAPNVFGGQTLVPYDVLIEDPVYRATLVEAGVRQPDNPLLADLAYQNDVWKRFAVESVHAGQVPLWNSDVFGGIPFLASGQHSVLYPSFLLFLALPVEQAFTWNALMAFWLAGVTAYVLGRALGLGRLASLVMGVTWSSSLIMVANVVFPMIQGVFVWTPLVLAGIEAAAAAAADAGRRGLLPHGRALVWLVVVALATALTALSGHVEMLYYAGLLSASYAVFRLVQAGQTSRRGAALTAMWLLSAAALGILLAATQLVPMAELARTNWRSGADAYETVRGYAFGLRQLITFFVPDAFGNPSHHAVLDIVRGRRMPVDGDAMWGVAWGTKNYVEAAAYIGVLPLVLAVIGLFNRARRSLAVFLAAVAAVSLSFAFGLPTYRLLFAALPGFDQLHTPFRWVFPYALCIVMLAGLGMERLCSHREGRWPAFVGVAAAAAGLAACLALWAFARVPRLWSYLVEGATSAADGARSAALGPFGTMDAFASYQFWNLAHLAAFVTLSGIAIVLVARSVPRGGPSRWSGALILGVIAADLALVGLRFNPSVDPALASVRPETVEWLADAVSAKWGRVVGYGMDKTLWPNSAMRVPVGDVRGYDSMIPTWIVETYNTIDTGSPSLAEGAPRHGMLAYNRLGNLTRPESLRHPALSALGARYVVTTDDLASQAGLSLVHSDPSGVRVYENPRAMPRVWVVDQVEVIPRREQLLSALSSFDPTTTVLLEEVPDRTIWSEVPGGRAIARPNTRVRADTETGNAMEIEVVGASQGGVLVMSDSWYPGWKAEVQPAGSQDAFEVPVYRANSSMRAVPVPPGLSTVKMRYSPMSLKVGLYGSFLAAVMLLLACAYTVWDRLFGAAGSDRARLVAMNSFGPMSASMVNKVVDFAFAMLMLRVLGSENAGYYYYAIAVIGFAEIFTNFGLNLLTTREVAREPGRAGEYLVGTSVLRLLMWAACIPMLAAYLTFERASGAPVGAETAMAIALLAVSLLPGAINTALSSVFQGLERMVLPAGVSIVATLVKVSLGALVLLAGFGFVGLAGVSIVTNLVTLVLLLALLVKSGVRPALPGAGLGYREMLGQSWPLMLNHLLMTLFFKVDVVLLRRIQGAVVVGWYSTAYKWVDALLIIPPAVTMALFPVLSRHATGDRSSLRRTYAMALRWLITLALPIAAVTTFASDFLIRLLGGPEYLPHGAIALRIMIWFLPFSFANGLTQYVLIALDRQRWITRSFVVAASFNVVANLLVIPRYSYSGAAAVTIASEIVLLVPFLWGLRDIGAPPLLILVWRPAMATSLMAAVMATLAARNAPTAAIVAVGCVVFAAALLALGGVRPEDRALLARLARPGAAGAPPVVDQAKAG